MAIMAAKFTRIALLLSAVAALALAGGWGKWG
jgi:hypothetical protein